MLVILKDSQRFKLFVILDSIIALYVGSCKFDYSLLSNCGDFQLVGVNVVM